MFCPTTNFEKTKKKIGFVSRKEATTETYSKLGFMSGLEVHQQLKTEKKLFCRCPAGHYHDFEDFDAEIIRHMRPTLSELGEYDGTALMEFKTKKEIIYRLNNKTSCTYEIDDTPPFAINKDALRKAMIVSKMLKQNIVGELHITRKQYLDGSIPTGFQRTAIVGIEGEIPLKNKTIRIIQLSIEEDSCREISDVGHKRVYITDRLGMPLIETVTYPEMLTPDELFEGAQYIRFLNRASGVVRVGIGAGREDVNVSIKGGTRVEIKGVAHNKWIPDLSHGEAFRQRALLEIKKDINERISSQNWKIHFKEIDPIEFDLHNIDVAILGQAIESSKKIIAVNLPQFEGIISHFTQFNKCFLDEISNRLKVIACLEKPNIYSSEDLQEKIPHKIWRKISSFLGAEKGDAQLLFWADEIDVKEAIDTIKERCLMAFEGVPNETRKSFEDGSTIFERVLPGADRMYPDTDSAPIPISDEEINTLSENLPITPDKRIAQLTNWNCPKDAFTFILRNNLTPLIEKIITELDINPLFAITLFSHKLKNCEGILECNSSFEYDTIFRLLSFLKGEKIQFEIAFEMLPILYENPQMEFESILSLIDFQKFTKDEILSEVKELHEIFLKIKKNKNPEASINWIMGNLRKKALGNIELKSLRNEIKKIIEVRA